MTQHDEPYQALSTWTPNPKGRDLRRFMVRTKHGKGYLQVAGRLVLFRDCFPDFGIETEALRIDDEIGYALFKATIRDKDGRIVSQAHGSETVKDFGDYAEKAETKAVGRCLAYLGFGTDAAGYELDEGGRVSDSTGSGAGAYATTERSSGTASDDGPFECGSCGTPITKARAELSRNKNNGAVVCPRCEKSL